jgi:hypothetical protein
MKQYTPGPWRWADRDTFFGEWESPSCRLDLEFNVAHPGESGIVLRARIEHTIPILTIEDPIKAADAELIRRAPELAEALHEMLDMFGGNMAGEDYRVFRELAGER